MSGQVNYVEIKTISGEIHDDVFQSEVSGTQLDNEIYDYYLKSGSYVKIEKKDRVRYIKTDNIEYIDFIDRPENEDEEREIEQIPVTWI